LLRGSCRQRSCCRPLVQWSEFPRDWFRPPWLRLSSTAVASSIEPFGRREAQASVIATSNSKHDAHIFLRFRLYNRSGYQVAVCTNGPQPVFSDMNLLVPADSSARIGCSVDAFRDVADVPVSVRVELLGWELSQ